VVSHQYRIYILFTQYILLLASVATTAETETKPTNASAGTQMNMSATCTSLTSKVANGNTVSCVIELKTVWFNFAAPPRTPITRKIDYTRLDWNLLSTASPAINAWMNPSNKFAIRIVHMFRTMYRRSTAIVACLMAEALDVQGIHMPLKVYNLFLYNYNKESFFYWFSLILTLIFLYIESLRKINAISKNIAGRSFLSIMYYIAELRFTVRNCKY